MIVNNTIRLAIADDHQIVIDGLAAALKEYKHLSIVLTGVTGEQVIELLSKQKVDILITDMMMPGMDGQQLAEEVRKRYPEIRIMALSMSGSGYMVDDLIRKVSIDGYLLKQCGITELVHAIEIVYAGGTYFQASVTEELAKVSRQHDDLNNTRLTPREKQIIALMERDLSNKEISATLFISVRTVETHRKNIFSKTGTNNVLTLVKWAYEHNILRKG